MSPVRFLVAPQQRKAKQRKTPDFQRKSGVFIFPKNAKTELSHKGSSLLTLHNKAVVAIPLIGVIPEGIILLF